MREFILKLGHFNLTLLIGLFSILLSVFIAYSAILLFDIPFVWSNFVLAIIIPAIIAPSVSWFFLKLYFKVEKLERDMRTLATYDTLTGLLSRKAFLSRGELLYKQIQQKGNSVIVLYFDLDNFKNINDTYGHDGGDKVLSYFGTTLLNTFRENDLIGRLGGEEIAVMLLPIELIHLIEIIKSIQENISSANIMQENKSINFTTSIGIAIAKPKDKLSLDTLISQADKALYKAKNSGKNCAYIYKGEGDYEQLVSTNKPL